MDAINGTNGDNLNTEKHLLKRKMASLCYLASLDKWTLDDAIYISFMKDDWLLMNNPHLNANAAHSDTILDINIADINIDKFGNHVADFLLHFLIHSIRSNYNSILFVYCPIYVQKVMELGGIQAISQESMLTNSQHMATFDYDKFQCDLQSCAQNEEELHAFLRKQVDFLTTSLQPSQKLLLKNRGFLVIESSIEKCWYHAFQIMYSIETHMKLGSYLMSEHLIKPTLEAQQSVTQFESDGVSKMLFINKQEETPNYKDGELEMEAAMRYIDAMGLKTEYDFKEVNIWKKVPSDGRKQ